MILSKCPLRISLVGGSSDLEEFIQNQGFGSVISFPCNLYTYNTVFVDKNGYNRNSREYIVDYTKVEKTDSIEKIKNNVARYSLDYFKSKPLKVSFYSDIFSHGSGLACSSAYVISLVKALSVLESKRLSQFNICKTALEIERNFNPLTGRQDTFGCGIGGLKRLEFFPKQNVSIPLDDTLLNNFDMYLIYTGIKRKSTDLLKTLNFEKVKNGLQLVPELEKSILKKDDKTFFKIIKEGWKAKLKTSKQIQSNIKLIQMDTLLSKSSAVKAHKLCGAGGGGYFLVFTEKDVDLEKSLSPKIRDFNKISFKINIDNKGVSHTIL